MDRDLQRGHLGIHGQGADGSHRGRLLDEREVISILNRSSKLANLGG